MKDREPLRMSRRVALEAIFAVGATVASAPAVIGLAKFAGGSGGGFAETIKQGRSHIEKGHTKEEEQFLDGLLITTVSLMGFAGLMTVLENRLKSEVR